MPLVFYWRLKQALRLCFCVLSSGNLMQTISEPRILILYDKYYKAQKQGARAVEWYDACAECVRFSHR